MSLLIVEAGTPLGNSEAMRAWCERHGIAAQDTYRVECDPERMVATVHQYERNADGNLFLSDRAAKTVARRAPFEVPITSLPSLQEEPAT